MTYLVSKRDSMGCRFDFSSRQTFLFGTTLDAPTGERLVIFAAIDRDVLREQAKR